MAFDSTVCAGTSEKLFGLGFAAGAKDQSSAARPSGRSRAARALTIAASILARLRTMPRVGEQPRHVGVGELGDPLDLEAPRTPPGKRDALRKMISQDRPDWNASRLSRSYRPASSRIGAPHSESLV